MRYILLSLWAILFHVNIYTMDKETIALENKKIVMFNNVIKGDRDALAGIESLVQKYPDVATQLMVTVIQNKSAMTEKYATKLLGNRAHPLGIRKRGVLQFEKKETPPVDFAVICGNVPAFKVLIADKRVNLKRTTLLGKKKKKSLRKSLQIIHEDFVKKTGLTHGVRATAEQLQEMINLLKRKK